MEINRNNYELEQIGKRLLELEQEKVALFSQKKNNKGQAYFKAYFNNKKL